jgi:signal transduction histidine kinase
MKPSSSLRWLTVALLVLGTLAWRGTRSQVRAAWSAAREDAKGAVGISAGELARNLAAAVETVNIYPDPPLPGTRSAADDVLDGNDTAALRKLRDNPEAGISPAGLPRRVLAGFRVYENTKAAADGAALLAIATGDALSVLTPRVFALLPAGDWPERWARGERAREVFRRHPEVGAAGAWVSENDGTWWLASGNGELRAISPDAVQRALTESAKFLPAWAGLEFMGFEAAEGRRAPQPASGRAIPPGAIPIGREKNVPSFSDVTFTSPGHEASARLRHPQAAEVLASAPVDFAGGVTLEIVAARPDLLEAAAREQARWTLGLLAFAVAISGGALWLIHRAVARERRLNALKSDFVASVSHELRAPVASIRLMADALGAGKIKPQTVAEFHTLISRESARLSALIENVLDFARIEQGRKRWDMEETELAPLVRESLELMAPLAADKSVKLAVAGPLPEVIAYVDAGAIRQVLVNLLDNAIKFSQPGASVVISLAVAAADWCISISDNGPGIAAAEHARIFERFYRIGSELRRETQGAGIGLSLVKAVAEAHGGRVTLQSARGAGSTFTIKVPINPIRPISP